MGQATGRVDRINSKSGNTNGRAWAAYSIQIDGNWWNYGFETPPCKEGDTISYDMGKDKKGYDTASNVVVTASQPAGAAPATAGAAPVNTRDISIMYQSSRKDALVLLPLLFEQGAYAFPAKTRAADKYDLVMSIVDEITARNYLVLQDVIANGGVDAGDMIPAPGE